MFDLYLAFSISGDLQGGLHLQGNHVDLGQRPPLPPQLLHLLATLRHGWLPKLLNLSHLNQELPFCNSPEISPLADSHSHCTQAKSNFSQSQDFLKFPQIDCPQLSTLMQEGLSAQTASPGRLLARAQSLVNVRLLMAMW